MTDMFHQIAIEAPAADVFSALTEEAGLRSWWTGDSSCDAAVGNIAEFGFGDRATVFRMRIDELVEDERVVWYCIGDVDEWRGTRLVWELGVDGTTTVLRFTHADWRSTDGWYAPCNTTWGALMHRLKEYAEGERPGPLFTG